jgi:hypothetical protein
LISGAIQLAAEWNTPSAKRYLDASSIDTLTLAKKISTHPHSNAFQRANLKEALIFMPFGLD